MKVALFKKKNQENEQAEAEKKTDLKELILEGLHEKLGGHVYDGCLIIPRGGFTIDVNISRRDQRDEVRMAQIMFVIKNDEFDEPIIDPVDCQGRSEEELANLAVQIFYGGVWHPIEQSQERKNPLPVSVDYLRQHYDFDMYAQSIVRIGIKENAGPPRSLVSYIKSEIPKYLGSKKYYWIRIYLAKQGDRKIVDVRVNGSVCYELAKYYQAYVDSWDASKVFLCEKQYALFVQHEDDKCPFTKETVTTAAKTAIDMMVKIQNREQYNEMAKHLDEITENPSLAAEIRIFVPEIFAKLTLGYSEGDSLFLITDDNSRIEFRKTQLRSYFYIQQVILEYLSTNPPKEDVVRIVSNSVAFRELKKAKEESGHEPKDLHVPGTSYRILTDDYKVW